MGLSQDRTKCLEDCLVFPMLIKRESYEQQSALTPPLTQHFNYRESLFAISVSAGIWRRGEVTAWDAGTRYWMASQLLDLWSSLLLMHTLEHNRWQINYLGPRHPHGRPVLNSPLLALFGPRLGWNGTFSLFPFALKCNKNKSINLNILLRFIEFVFIFIQSSDTWLPRRMSTQHEIISIIKLINWALSKGEQTF